MPRSALQHVDRFSASLTRAAGWPFEQAWPLLLALLAALFAGTALVPKIQPTNGLIWACDSHETTIFESGHGTPQPEATRSDSRFGPANTSERSAKKRLTNDSSRLDQPISAFNSLENRPESRLPLIAWRSDALAPLDSAAQISERGPPPISFC